MAVGGLVGRSLASILGRFLGRTVTPRTLGTAGGTIGRSVARRVAGVGATGLGVFGVTRGLEGVFGGGEGGAGPVTGPIQELTVGMILPDGFVVGKVWSTNRDFNNMGQSLDGKKGIALRTNGTVRIFTYPKHIVVSRNPRVGSLSRAARRLDTMTNRLIKSRPAAKRAGERMKGKKKVQ